MCRDQLVNWPVNLSLISYFPKSVSSLSIKLLATKASVFLTKNPFVTFQSTDNAMQHFFKSMARFKYLFQFLFSFIISSWFTERKKSTWRQFVLFLLNNT